MVYRRAWFLLLTTTLFALGSVLLFGSTRVLTAANSDVLYSSKSDVMQTLTQKTNELRATKNLPALMQSQKLELSANDKLRNMQEQRYWGHYAPDGSSFSQYIWQYDNDAQLVGENLARCYVNYDAAFAALVNSPTHYQVLMGDFTHIGISSQLLQDGCESIVMHFSNS